GGGGQQEEKEEEEEQGGGRKGATVGARPVSRAVLKHEALPAGWRGQEEAPRGRRPRAAPWRRRSHTPQSWSVSQIVGMG
ncbi:unnamed protein product, partial [Prorocentrum cordatum]